jgi:hypothetical protein
LSRAHASIQITVDTYGHLIPSANRPAADRLDDAPMQPTAPQAQPEPFDEDPTLQEMQELFGRVVSLNFTSWNQAIAFIRRIDELRRVA